MKNKLNQAVFFGGPVQGQHQPIGYNCNYKYSLLTSKIERALKDQGINKQQFASIMGVTPSLISKWLSGKHNFTIETLFTIEDKLGLKLIDIETPSFEVITIHASSGSYLPSVNNEILPSTIETYRTDFRTGSVIYPGAAASNQIRYMKAINLDDK